MVQRRCITLHVKAADETFHVIQVQVGTSGA